MKQKGEVYRNQQGMLETNLGKGKKLILNTAREDNRDFDQIVLVGSQTRCNLYSKNHTFNSEQVENDFYGISGSKDVEKSFWKYHDRLRRAKVIKSTRMIEAYEMDSCLVSGEHE